MISYKDKDAQTIKQNAYNTVKQLAKQQAVQNTKAEIKQQQVAPETNSTIALLNAELQKAVREGNIQLATEYTKMIAQLSAPQPQAPVAEETNEEEIPEDVQDENVDPTEGADEIEL
jgi:hypothetical protein